MPKPRRFRFSTWEDDAKYPEAEVDPCAECNRRPTGGDCRGGTYILFCAFCYSDEATSVVARGADPEEAAEMWAEINTHTYPKNRRSRPR